MDLQIEIYFLRSIFLDLVKLTNCAIESAIYLYL